MVAYDLSIQLHPELPALIPLQLPGQCEGLGGLLLGDLPELAAFGRGNLLLHDAERSVDAAGFVNSVEFVDAIRPVSDLHVVLAIALRSIEHAAEDFASQTIFIFLSN